MNIFELFWYFMIYCYVMSFEPKTERISKLVDLQEERILELEKLFGGSVMMYIDYANVRPWSQKLKWHVDIKRLKQFIDSFNQITSTKFYQGILDGDERSESEAREVVRYGYEFRTKPVKIMKIPIKADTIPEDSTAIISNFIRKALLRKLDTETVKYLNHKLADLNKRGELYVEDRKCNFDVEIGVDMLLDYEHNNVDTFVLWSGDSDFYDPVLKLLKEGKKVILFATAGRVARELNDLRGEGLIIYDIKKTRDFICWKREMTVTI